jgi:hypothetical protein
METQVQSRVTSCKFHGESSGTGADSPPSLFSFTQITIILQLFHTNLYPLPEVCDSFHQAAHFYIVGPQFCGCICDSALDWIPNMAVSFPVTFNIILLSALPLSSYHRHTIRICN